MESVAYMQSVRAELISTVAIQYYTLLSLEAQETIYEQTEKNWRENVETTVHLMEAGQYTAAAVHQARASWYGVLNSLSDIRLEIRQTENQICSLTGKPSGSIIPRGSLGSWKAPESVREGSQLRRAGKQS